MDEKWMKPTVEEMAVNGECTAYAGVDAARMMGEETAVAQSIPAIVSAE